MKMPIDDVAVIDIKAPVPTAYETRIRGAIQWLVRFRHCKKWHRHIPAEGHRVAHCQDRSNPYWETGYNLAYAGKWRAGPGPE
jgi:hypothetical protein